MNVANMVDEIAQAVSATVSRSVASLQRQLEELIAWRKSVGELRNGVDGRDGTQGIAGKDGSNGLNGKDAPHVDVDLVVSKVLAQIPVPKDGARGADGRDGRDGIDGADGKPGNDGKSGADGRDGIDGKIGDKGDPGINGKDGSPGRDGKDGADGLHGKDGLQGLRGDKGDIASPEDIADAVTKAVNALLPSLVSKQVEQTMPEIIARASVLVPPGRDGLPGRPGTPGDPGRDGASIQDIQLEKSGPRLHELTVRLTDGSITKHPIHLEGMLLDADVHRSGESYSKGDAVTHGGSYWVARKDTTEAPGKSDDWRMVVKRGRDGKDAE